MNDTAVQEGVYPVLVLRDVLVFPYVVTSVFVGREKSIHALEAAMAQQKQIMLVAQKDSLLRTRGLCLSLVRIKRHSQSRLKCSA